MIIKEEWGGFYYLSEAGCRRIEILADKIAKIMDRTIMDSGEVFEDLHRYLEIQRERPVINKEIKERNGL